MNLDDIYFDSVKESRDWYFVDYKPPLPNHRFSTLGICVVDAPPKEDVASAIEQEAREWLRRYEVPLMATAFSADDEVFSLEGVRPCNHLMVWPNADTACPIVRWGLVDNSVLPETALDREFLKKTFADVPSRTQRQIRDQVLASVKTRKTGWWLFFIWAVIVPLVVAILEWWSDLLGLAVLAYAFFKAATKALQLTGRLPRSTRERGKQAEDLKMRHHHYHCERNPEAFERLKAENLRREQAAENESEHLALRSQGRNGQTGE